MNCYLCFSLYLQRKPVSFPNQATYHTFLLLQLLVRKKKTTTKETLTTRKVSRLSNRNKIRLATNAFTVCFFFFFYAFCLLSKLLCLRIRFLGNLGDAKTSQITRTLLCTLNANRRSPSWLLGFCREDNR